MANTLEEFKSHLSEFFNPKKSKEVSEPKVELQEEVKETKEVKEEPQVAYVTSAQLSEVKNELLSMIKSLIEENRKEVKEVPAELSKEEPKEDMQLSTEEVKEVELSEVEEIVHTPEVETKNQTIELQGASPLERIQYALNK